MRVHVGAMAAHPSQARPCRGLGEGRQAGNGRQDTFSRLNLRAAGEVRGGQPRRRHLRTAGFSLCFNPAYGDLRTC